MTSPLTAGTTAIRKATEQDARAVVDVLSLAFQDDPVVAWLIPDPARRAELNPALFRIVVDGHIPLGEVYAAEEDTAAAAVWAPPGLEADEEAEAEFAAAFLEACAENAGRAETVFGLMAEVHPKEDHAYLFFLAARPERQSQGLGSALLRHVLDRLDADGVPAYLEATCEGNRRLYARHGFADVGLLQLPDGPPMFRMWRDPR